MTQFFPVATRRLRGSRARAPPTFRERVSVTHEKPLSGEGGVE
jgi:hypothetical protein